MVVKRYLNSRLWKKLGFVTLNRVDMKGGYADVATEWIAITLNSHKSSDERSWDLFATRFTTG